MRVKYLLTLDGSARKTTNENDYLGRSGSPLPLKLTSIFNRNLQRSDDILKICDGGFNAGDGREGSCEKNQRSDVGFINRDWIEGRWFLVKRHLQVSCKTLRLSVKISTLFKEPFTSSTLVKGPISFLNITKYVDSINETSSCQI